MTAEQTYGKLIGILATDRIGVTVKQIAQAIEQDERRTRNLLAKMEQQGMVTKRKVSRQTATPYYWKLSDAMKSVAIR